MDDRIIIEWNEEQQQFHAEPYEDRVSDSVRMYVEGRCRGPWVCLAVVNGHEKAAKVIKELKAIRQHHQSKTRGRRVFSGDAG